MFSYATYPVVWVLERITRVMIKLTGSDYHPPALTENEIKGIIDQGHRDDALESHERDLVHRALEFDDTVIRSVMTPRRKMQLLPAKMLLFEALPIINQNSHSRIPIYGETHDDIVGFIHVRDVLREMESDNKMKTLEQIARAPVYCISRKNGQCVTQRDERKKNTHGNSDR